MALELPGRRNRPPTLDSLGIPYPHPCLDYRRSEVVTALHCPHGEACGACTFLGMGYSAQLLRKRRTLRTAMQSYRSLANIEVQECLASPEIDGYRNRAKMAVAISKYQDPDLGYFRPRSREVEDAPDCKILEREILRTTRDFRNLLRSPVRVPKSLRHVDVRCGSDTHHQHLTLVFRSREMPDFPLERIRKACRRVNGISVNLNPSSGPQVIKGAILHQWGEREIYVDVGDLSLRVSPGSFFQVNLSILPKIHALMADFLGKGHTLADLYSGVGTHGLALHSQFERIIAVEGVRSSVADAKATAKRFKLSHMTVVPKPVERALQPIRDAAPESVIMNPSRAGARADVLDALVLSGARKIVYLSCDPQSLCRDLDVLVNGGFKVVQAQPIDMMPQTRQVEAMVLLQR